jgi:hypothetical protein
MDEQNRSRLQSYIRPLCGDIFFSPGPDGNRALVPHLLGVIAYVMTSRLSGSTRAGLTCLTIHYFYARRSFAVKENIQDVAWYASPLARSAHRIRAFLLAKATAVRLIPRRSFSLPSHWFLSSFCVLQRNTMDLAP